MAHPMSFLATLSSSVLCRRSQSCLSLSSHGTPSLGAGHSSRQSSSRREMPSVSRVMDRLQVGTGHGAEKDVSQKPVRFGVRRAAS